MQPSASLFSRKSRASKLASALEMSGHVAWREPPEAVKRVSVCHENGDVFHRSFIELYSSPPETLPPLRRHVWRDQVVEFHAPIADEGGLGEFCRRPQLRSSQSGPGALKRPPRATPDARRSASAACRSIESISF